MTEYRKNTLLIIDDEQYVIRLIESALQKEFAVLTAMNGEQGLEIAKTKRPDVIILDVMMPGMGGFEVCSRLKADPCTSTIPVIFATALDRDEDEIRGLEIGADDYITKPIRVAVLLTRVRQLLRRVKAEGALLQSEARYRAVVNDSPLMICRFGPDNVISYVNRAYCQYFQKTEQELAGESFLSLIPEADHEHVLAHIASLTPENPLCATTHRVIAPGGAIRWHRWTDRALFNNEGMLVGYQAIGEDITKFKQALDALHVKDQAMAASKDALALADLDGRLTYVNPAFLNLWGYARDEDVLGRSAAVFWESEQEARDKINRIVLRGRAEGEMAARRADGKLVDVCISATLVHDEQGRPICMMASFRDISERLRSQRELLQAKRQAEAATLAKSEFLANMSHEIRTPMNGVIGMAGLLLDTDLDPEQRRYAESIEASGEALLALLNDILDFSKIEAGRLDLECMDFDLRHLLDDFAASMAVRAHEKGLEFVCYAEPHVPSRLQGDPTRLRQILNNLVGNAVKFTDRGEVAVRVSLVHGSRFNGSAVEEAKGGFGAGAKNLSPEDVAPHASSSATAPTPTVNPEPLNPDPSGFRSQVSAFSPSENEVLLRFSVKDTGIGIPEDKISFVFEKFSQVDSSTTRKFGGTGLGLTISRQLAGMMGGDIGVDSKLGRGSEFWFTACFDMQEALAEERRAPVRDLHDVHVLVVDDNATNREILMKQLASWRMRPEEADCGAAALAILEMSERDGDPFELAVVDMHMPGMDGAELGRIIKADPRFQAIPLVMLTSLGLPGEARRFAELGFTAYLNKPVRQSEFYDTLILTLANDSHLPTQTSPIITRHLARERLLREASQPRFSGNVLVAEDNPVNQMVALGILKKFGLDADVAANGLEVLEALARRSYDLVLMDVQMPEMDGVEATRRIRAAEDGGRKTEDGGSGNEEWHPSSAIRLPIIAMTAGAMQKDNDRCLEAGMDDYVVKPVNPVELARVLGRWLPDDGGQKADEGGQGAEGGTHAPAQSVLPGQVAQEREGQGCPVFDKASLLRRMMGDAKLAQEVMLMFLKILPERVAALKEHIASRNEQAAVLMAHTLKGSAMNSGFPALAKVAKKMEFAGKDGDLESMAALLPELDRQVALCGPAAQADAIP